MRRRNASATAQSGKWKHSAFCAGCYDDLSIQTKIKLTRKFREGFKPAFRRAYVELDGSEPPPDKTDDRLLAIWKSMPEFLAANGIEFSDYNTGDPVGELADLIRKECGGDIRNSEIAKLMCLMFLGSDAEILEKALSEQDFGC